MTHRTHCEINDDAPITSYATAGVWISFDGLLPHICSHKPGYDAKRGVLRRRPQQSSSRYAEDAKLATHSRAYSQLPFEN